MPSETPRLTVGEKVGYGLGDFASNMFWQMFSIYIAKFYTDVFLLSAAAMGTMMLVTRMADAVIDPLIGTIADRTNTRWGHFRPYLMWMAVPMAVTAVLAFTTPDFSPTGKVIYAYVTLSLMMVAYSAINIPYSALLGVLTPDSRDRTSASTYRFVLAFLPIFLIVYTAVPLATYFGGSENSPYGWRMTMTVYAAIAVVFFLMTFLFTKERVQPEPKEEGALREDLKDLLANRPWVILCIVGIAALTFSNIRGAVLVYYFDHVVPNGKSYFSQVMSTGAIAFILGVMVTSPLAKRFGKRRFYMVSMGVTAVITLGYYFVPPNNIPLVWAGHGLISFCAAPTAPLVWAMYADTADYSEWKSGRRATGLVFSAASFAQKFGWAIGGGGAGWLLAYFGYLPNVTLSPRTVQGIILMVSVIPAVAAVIAVVGLWFYELDEPLVQQIGADLAARRMKQPATVATVASAVLPTASAALAATTTVVSVGNPVTRVSVESAAWGGGRPPSGADAARFSQWVSRAVSSAPVLASSVTVTSEARDSLVDQFRATLASGVHGFCFSPYVAGQGPGTIVSAEQIAARLEIVRPYTQWIRTFSCTDGHEHTPRLARRLGMKTLVGAWLGTDRAINEREIEAAIAIARAGDADLLAIGNEVLLREELSEDELIGYLERVRAAVPDVPVGYVDAYYLFELHPRLTAACDVILTNCYPFWEGCPRPQALAYMQDMLCRTRAVAGGKRVIISETGWPHTGSAFHGAVPSPENALQYFVDTCAWGARDGIEIFYFAAFDEAWKVGAEGDVGAYWGLWDTDGRLKYE